MDYTYTIFYHNKKDVYVFISNDDSSKSVTEKYEDFEDFYNRVYHTFGDWEII